jgi:hypothetical protein
MAPMQFHRGDRVRHAVRPEWGEGVVEQAGPAPSAGAQRLVVTFTNHGRVTVNTAFASIIPANGNGHDTAAPAGWLDRVAGQNAAVASNPLALSELPEACTDPFASLASRLRATLDLYRFDRGPRALIDWAVAQTGLTDPLSQYNRHELEQQFEAFERARQNHLIDLLRTAKRNGEQATVGAIHADAPGYAKAALQQVRGAL